MNLVIQGDSMTEDDVRQVRQLSKAAGQDPLAAHAYRLVSPDEKQKPAVQAYCDAHRIDHAWIAEGRRFADLRLLAMDMDSTLINIECIDEIGDFAGRKREIAAITAQAMRGEIDYPESLRRRVSFLEGLPESAMLEVYEKRLQLTPGADILVGACKRHGVKLLLVSGGFTFFTDRLNARLGIDYAIANRLEVVAGKLTGKLLGDIVDADAKARRFLEVMSELRTEKARTVAIGDGANDLKMMAQAGTSVAFHAKPVVRAQASCAITYSGLDAVLNLFE